MDSTRPHSAGISIQLRQRSPIPLDLNLVAAGGELLALVGPSGSGKTTTLRSAAGLHRPTSGRITCNGSTWFDSDTNTWVPARRRRIGMVMQSYALFPHLTAAENIMESFGDRRAADRRAEAESLLTRMNLGGLADRLPGQLSGGQQQRVAVARAVARRPDVLLLDEPFAAVDRMTRRRLRDELSDLRQELTMPVILVTHDLDDVVRLADQVCVMHGGAILQSGTVDEVMKTPISLVSELLDLGPRRRSATR